MTWQSIGMLLTLILRICKELRKHFSHQFLSPKFNLIRLAITRWIFKITVSLGDALTGAYVSLLLILNIYMLWCWHGNYTSTFMFLHHWNLSVTVYAAKTDMQRPLLFYIYFCSFNYFFVHSSVTPSQETHWPIINSEFISVISFASICKNKRSGCH